MSDVSNRAMLSSSASTALRFRFLDCDAAIYTDSEAFAELFREMYGRMIPPGSVEEARLLYGVFTTCANPWGRPVVVRNQEVWPVDNPAVLQWFGHEGILMDVLRRVRSHFLVHAGVVARDDQAILLVGESSYGKTTLALELVRRGFHFLSDDLAPISRTSNRVDAFPRSPRIRQGTLELLGVETVAYSGARWMDKLIVDVERLFPGVLCVSAQLCHVICLYDAAAPPLSARAKEPLRIWLERVPPELDAYLASHPDITGVAVESYEGFPLLTLHTQQKQAVLAEVEAIAQRSRTPILNVWRRAEHRPRFDGPAQLTPVSAGQILPDILQQFQPGAQSAILQEYNHEPALLLLELADRIAKARCYRLQVGPLSEMADAICAALDG